MTEQSMTVFPQDFLWGTATAAYQIEGAANEAGRGVSIWDVFSHTPGRTLGGDTGDVACDHYHRWREDIDELERLGIGAYRFSVSWPRILPEGRGEINEDGLVFYEGIIDELISRGIEPILTLYHWDLPQALEDEGGWASRSTALAFVDYARVLARRFGSKVSVWTTLNEPWCSAYLGYASGVHAPGRQEPAAALAAVHHLNLAHGLAARAIRDEVGDAAKISVTLNLHVVRGDDPQSAQDLLAVEQIESLANGAFLGPILEGEYPRMLLDITAPHCDWSFVLDGDLEITRTRLDVLGVNYYSPVLVRACEPGMGASGADGHGNSAATPWIGADGVEFVAQPGPYTEMGWPVDATGLTELLVSLSRKYVDLPLMVTENGAAYPDPDRVDPNEQRVHDPQRVRYLHDHIKAVRMAIEAGADVRGYFAWSLMDNFEWAYGYSKRFGILHVDYDTFERTWKDSAHWYSKLAKTGAIAKTNNID
ncbi:GH1 family beta-glucosidase [Schaalia vaccimaxillae]|uniref:GH1 family beta-glucosidase n=1 Tax=Schaalia vaccimaxillae TaxID=183916 RepID=UPI0003B35D21|nr:GH1 family beta-glucosidase [Schaalia vaccimaxillae]